MIWTGTKQQLLVFLEKVNNKHKTNNSEHNISHRNISILDKLIYRGKKNTLQANIYPKPTDQQSHLHAYSGHPNSFTKVYRIAKR